ncbi:hypothetical protein KIPB_006046, partial [Kipferlia bialata]|eukprot:g6046.t1
MAPKKWYLSCREINLGRGRVEYPTVATYYHNTILAASSLGQVDRFTVDPATLAVTDVVQLMAPLVGGVNRVVHPVLVSDTNTTVLVTTIVLVQRLPNGVRDYTPSPLEVRVFYPDSGVKRHLVYSEGAKWPQPRFLYSTAVVNETLVVLGGFNRGSAADVPGDRRVYQDMWCLDLQHLDSTDPWRVVALKSRLAQELCSPKLRASSNMGDSISRFYGPHSISVSLSGTVALTPGVMIDDPTIPRRLNWDFAVNVGPFTCLFGSVIGHTLEGEDEGTHCVYMYDRVSGDTTLYEPLPFPYQVISACMLNPTTMLVVQEERTL